MRSNSTLDVFRRMMIYMKPRIRKYFIGMIVMTIMFSLMSIIQSISLKYLIEAAAEKNIHKLILTTGGLLIATIFLIVFIPIFRYMYNGRAVAGKGDIKVAAFRHIIRLPVKYFENTHSGLIMTNITSDIEVASSLYTVRLHLSIAPFIYASFSITPMLILNWRISSILIIVNMILASVNLIFTKPIKKLSQNIQESQAEFSEKLFNMIAGFHVMKIFHIEKLIGEYYTKASDKIAKHMLKRVHISACVESLNGFISMACNIGMILIGSWMVDMNLDTIGTILTLINLQGRVNGAFLQAGHWIPQLQDSFVSGSRVFKLIDTEGEPESYETPKEVSPGTALGMKKVYFGYGEENRTINDVSFTVKYGQIAALVGPSGSGKSTILKLLLGFYPPDTGNITIHEKSLGQYSLSQIRDLIAYVPQDPYLFYGTIEENIRYGNINASEEAVIEAAKAACAHEFIMQQPEGYKTFVGERGAALSGGQRQRIAIARAFLKNSPILLLDEATSSLDSESEKYLHEAMNNLMQNRTILVIAHRLSTIENADIIYFIRDGEIAEQGNHAELLKRNGFYKDLYDTQFSEKKVG